MGLKYQREAASWKLDKDRFLSGEWSRDDLLEVTIWRCWNNLDIARRVRGKNPHIGGATAQKESWRTFVAAKVVDGGLDTFDVQIAGEALAWLDQQHYKHTPERDSCGGDDPVEYSGTTVSPLWPTTGEIDHVPMPRCLKKRKAVA